MEVMTKDKENAAKEPEEQGSKATAPQAGQKESSCCNPPQSTKTADTTPEKAADQTDKKKDTLIQALKFTLLSISAGGVEFLSFLCLEAWSGLPYSWIHVISVVLSVLWNFTLNRRFTFKSTNNIPIAMLKVAAFYLAFIPITAWGGQLAANQGISEVLVKICTMLLNFVGEFLWWKFVVFRGSENTNDLAKKSA